MVERQVIPKVIGARTSILTGESAARAERVVVGLTMRLNDRQLRWRKTGRVRKWKGDL